MSGGLLQPHDEYSDGGRSATRTIRVPYDGGATSPGWAALIPAVGAAHPVCDWLTFAVDGWELRQLHRNPRLADLVLRYEATEWTATYKPALPDDECSEDVAALEIDLVRHPSFHAPITGAEAVTSAVDASALALADLYNPLERRIFFRDTIPDVFTDHDGETKPHPHKGTTVPAPLRGMSAYVVGSGTVRCVEYSYSEPTSLIDGGEVGKRNVPTGYSGSGASVHWLLMAARKMPQGGYWGLELVYQYSARDISEWIYEAGSL